MRERMCVCVCVCVSVGVMMHRCYVCMEKMLQPTIYLRLSALSEQPHVKTV